MTHDELIKRINGFTWHQQEYRAWNVIDELLKRHFPSGDCSDPECNPKHLWCNCGFEYPCEDIKIIQEEMSG